MSDKRDTSPKHGDTRTIKKRYSGWLFDWVHHPPECKPPKGKSVNDFAEDVVSAAIEGYSLDSAVSKASESPKLESAGGFLASGWDEFHEGRLYEEALAAANKKIAEQMAKPKPKREGAKPPLGILTAAKPQGLATDSEQWTCEPPTEDGYYWVVVTVMREDVRKVLSQCGRDAETQRMREEPVAELVEIEGMHATRVGLDPAYWIHSDYVKGWLWHKSGRIIAPEPPSCDPVELSNTLRAGVSIKQVIDTL